METDMRLTGGFMRILLALLIGLSLSACKSGGSEAGCGSKDFFSTWVATDNSHWLDFRGGSFNQAYSVYFDMGGGSRCTFDILATGQQCSGDITVANSTWNNVGVDPNCALLNGLYQFGKNTNGLSICSGGSCDNYQ